MKKRILSALLLMIILLTATAQAGDTRWRCSQCLSYVSAGYSFCPYCGAQPQAAKQCRSCGYQTNEKAFVYCPMCGVKFGEGEALHAYGVANQRLSTRSGPSTAYTDLGTYYVQGETLPIISLYTDSGGTTWVQTELIDRGDKRRVYTGIKRFNIDEGHYDLITIEDPSNARAAQLTSASTVLRDGPGFGYGVSKNQAAGETFVYVYAVENGWAQVELSNSERPFRAWVEVEKLRLQ